MYEHNKLTCEQFQRKYVKHENNMEWIESADISKFALIQSCNEILRIYILHKI